MVHLFSSIQYLKHIIRNTIMVPSEHRLSLTTIILNLHLHNFIVNCTLTVRRILILIIFCCDKIHETVISLLWHKAVVSMLVVVLLCFASFRIGSLSSNFGPCLRFHFGDDL